MDTMNSYRKKNAPKVIDAVNFHGRYMDSSAFKSKLVTISCATAFLFAFVSFIFLLLT